jgi:hypothetical protein
MKRRKRTSALPVVTKRSDGKYSVAISEGAHIIWLSEPAGDGLSRLFVKTGAPSSEFSIKDATPPRD